LCDEDKKAQIETLMAKSSDDLAAAIVEEEKKLEAAEDDFKASVEELQSTYQKLMETKDAKLAEVKDAGLGLMK
jgi:succinate dehydrogenase flavin-adding protein (antitoxin of CptAB toxin-antitoxin module)